jgi:hypothetical protein
MTLVAFLFVGLNVQRLKLSRDLLDTYLLKAQRTNRRLTNSESTVSPHDLPFLFRGNVAFLCSHCFIFEWIEK